MSQQGHSFTWLSHLPIVSELPSHPVMALLVGGAVLGFGSLAGKKIMSRLTSKDGGVIPEERLSLTNFFEIVAEKLYSLVENVMGEHQAKTYFPLIGSLFLFILTSNLIGLVPGFLPPTDNMNTTLALGLFVFLYYNFAGLKENGAGYLKHFLGPVWWLAWLILPIEIVGHMFRPLSLALRLRGNIMGDHVVLGVFSDLVPALLPVVFYGIGVFVAFIQAFVFCLMTMVYISLSTAHDH